MAYSLVQEVRDVSRGYEMTIGYEMTRVGTKSERHEMTEARDDSRGYEK